MSLQRATFSVSPNGRDRAVLVVAWVEVPDEEQAAELRELVDTWGTGSIRPLDRRVELTGQRYSSARDGAIVTLAEVEPDGRSPAGRGLEEIAESAAG